MAIQTLNSIMIFISAVFSFTLLLGYFNVIIDIRKKKHDFNSLQTFMMLLLALATVFVGFFCLIISKHYSVDSFNLIFDQSPYYDLQLGRYTNCGIILLTELGLDRVEYQQFYGFLWIIAVAISITVISISLLKCMKITQLRNAYFVTLSVAIAYVNIFFLEYMLFPECFAAGIIGHLALALSIYFFINAKNIFVRYIVSLIYLLIAIGNYQSFVGIYVTFVLLGILFKYSNAKQKFIWIDGVMALVIGGFSVVFNVALLKALIHYGITADVGRGAIFDIETILYNIEIIVEYQKSLWTNATGLMFPGVMPAIGVVCIILIIFCLKKFNYAKKIYFLLMLLGCYVLAFAPHIVESPIIITPRSNIAFWSVISAIFIASFGLIADDLVSLFRKCVCVAIVSILALNSLQMHAIAVNTSVTNAADFVEAEQVCEKIREYERDTGITVTKVAVVNDANPTVYHSFSRYNNVNLGTRIMITGYSGYRLVGYTLGRSLTLTSMSDQIYNEYFSGIDWDCLDVEEQLVFDADTMYWALY